MEIEMPVRSHHGKRNNPGQKTPSLVVNELFLSLQGESGFAGWPCIFIRLSGCNLRCSYCDTAYAFSGGQRLSVTDLMRQVQALARPFRRPAMNLDLPLVELTGGEPLLQPHAALLLRKLCEAGYKVLLETNGACDIAPVDARVHRIMDLKCPSSGEVEKNCWNNIQHLTPRDEIKFVIGTQEDYAWAKDIIRRHALAARCPLLFSWVKSLTRAQRHRSLRPLPPNHHPMSQRELAERIITDALPVRFQIQLHKYIWPDTARGV
jgi:7-carboxy-7-deazaguanine synthase